MRSPFFVLAALVIAAIGAFLFVKQDSTPAPQPAPAAGAPVAAPASLAEAVAPATADAPSPSDPNERTSVPAGDGNDCPPLPDDATWITLTIVDEVTKEPIAGADVWWTANAQWEIVQKLPFAERQQYYSDHERLAERFGWRARSDERGNARVTLGQQAVRVSARAGTRWGDASFMPGGEGLPEGHRVLLAEDHALRVRVLDHAGRPAAGVPIALEGLDPDGKAAQVHTGSDLHTGDDGVVRFAHVQRRRTVLWGPHEGKPVAQWSVRVVIEGIACEPALVDAQQPPVEPVEIRLPSTGRLVVRVTLDGRAPPGLRHVSIRPEATHATTAVDGAWSRPLGADGSARFPYVPLGKTFLVGLLEAGDAWQGSVRGPLAPDQEVVATFELLADVVALTGRLLDVDGSPLANEWLMADYDAGVSSGGHQVATDEQGRFVWLVDQPRRHAKRDVQPQLKRLSFARRSHGEKPHSVSVPPRNLVLGRNDLGDLRFGLGELAVAGRFVFDSPGSAQAYFQVERCSEREGKSGPIVRWSHVHELQTTVDEDGTFEARGALAPGRHRIAVVAGLGVQHLPVDPVEFTPGATGLEIRVRRGAPLVARCRLPEGLHTSMLTLRLELPGAPQPVQRPAGRPMLAGPGSGDPLVGFAEGESAGLVPYRWYALEPATYTLRVEANGFAEPFVTIADVVVPPPEGGDPRLADLDLREFVGTLKLRVRREPPTEQAAFVVFPQPQRDDQEWRGMHLRTESVMPVPKRAFDLVVASSNAQPVTVRVAPGECDVTLRKWPEVQVRIAGIGELPVGASLTVATIAPAGDVPERRFETPFWRGPVWQLLYPVSGNVPVVDGMATLPVGDVPAKLAIRVQLGDRSTRLQQFMPKEVAAGADVTVQLSADEIRAAIDELKQPPKKK